MPSIITTDFRLSNANAFVNAINTGVLNYYLAIGRGLPWAEGDMSPPTPADDSTQTIAYWGESFAAKKIDPLDILLSTERIDWASGTTYNKYNNTLNTNFYVMTDEYKVFKCLEAGSGTSTVKPQVTDALKTIPFRTADGYLWKFMFAVSISNALKFLTPEFIPVSPDATVEAAAVDGAIYSIDVVNGGTGYTVAPTISVEGPFVTQALATATVVGGVITKISVTDGSWGSGYSVANVVITPVSGGSGGVAKAIISPAGGHGSNAAAELISSTVAISNILTESLGSGDFPTINDYRRIMLVEGPTLYGTATVATGATYSTTYSLKIQHAAGSTSLPTDATLTGGTSGCSLSLLSADQVTSSPLVYNVRYTRDMFLNYKLPTLAETITVAGGGTWTVLDIASSQYLPELNHNSGRVIFVEQRRPISRAPEQSENIILFISF